MKGLYLVIKCTWHTYKTRQTTTVKVMLRILEKNECRIRNRIPRRIRFRNQLESRIRIWKNSFPMHNTAGKKHTFSGVARGMDDSVR